MEVPCRLFRLARGTISEEVPPGESGILLIAKGHTIPEPEAQRLGILDYLRQRARREPEQKAVDASEVENKAVAPEEVENKAVEGPGESKRQARIRRDEHI